MWTLKTSPQRLFAEFGSTETGKVVLRTKAGAVSICDRDDFSDADREVIDRGREWMSASSGKSFFGKLAKSDYKGVSFKKETGTGGPLSLDAFADSDKQIIRELVKLLLPKAEQVPEKKPVRPVTVPVVPRGGFPKR
jgi:hypothetical protein